MKKSIMSVFTRTPMHVGAGSSVGIVDLPIIRERHTGYPVIPGSSLKGVLADLWNDEANRERNAKNLLCRKGNSDAEKLFGVDNLTEQAASGKLLIGEGRVVAFPVRSAKGGFAWITCPLALGRYLRDSGQKTDLSSLKLAEMDCLAAKELQFAAKEGSTSIILEEYTLKCQNDTKNVLSNVAGILKQMSDDSLWQEELGAHLAILSDEMFKYFVESTCEIAQHVKISDETGTAEGGALFNQENVPSETMFYAVFHEAENGWLKVLGDKLVTVNNLLQIGADATTGLGWCSVALHD
jgi:CRISPR-associated protein Cmr4